MSESSSLPGFVRLLLRFVLTVLFLWILNRFLPQYISIGGGLLGLSVVAALLTILNIIVRPILQIITFPLKLFANIIALIIVNGVFLWLVEEAALRFNPNVVTVQITDGLMSWFVLAFLLGVMNWTVKEILR